MGREQMGRRDASVQGVSGVTGREILLRLVGSATHKEWARTHPVDGGKVQAEVDGIRRPRAGSEYARSVIDYARMFPGVTSPPITSALDPLWQRNMVVTVSL